MELGQTVVCAAASVSGGRAAPDYFLDVWPDPQMGIGVNEEKEAGCNPARPATKLYKRRAEGLLFDLKFETGYISGHSQQASQPGHGRSLALVKRCREHASLSQA